MNHLRLGFVRPLPAALCALLLIPALAGCRQEWPPNPKPVLIGSDADYAESLKKVEDLTKRPFERYENDIPLSGDDFTMLQIAHVHVLGMINYNPDAFGPRVILAKLLRAINSLDQAIAAYQEAIKLQPFNPSPAQSAVIADIRSDLAELYFNRREFEKAEDEFREAMRMRPSDVGYRLGLVQVLLEARRTDEAKRELAEAERQDAKHPGVAALKVLISGGSSSSSPKAGGTP